MGCYLSSLTIMIYKYLFVIIFFFKMIRGVKE